MSDFYAKESLEASNLNRLNTSNQTLPEKLMIGGGMGATLRRCKINFEEASSSTYRLQNNWLLDKQAIASCIS